jgi:hypothetical protein
MLFSYGILAVIVVVCLIGSTRKYRNMVVNNKNDKLRYWIENLVTIKSMSYENFAGHMKRIGLKHVDTSRWDSREVKKNDAVYVDKLTERTKYLINYGDIEHNFKYIYVHSSFENNLLNDLFVEILRRPKDDTDYYYNFDFFNEIENKISNLYGVPEKSINERIRDELTKSNPQKPNAFNELKVDLVREHKYDTSWKKKNMYISLRLNEGSCYHISIYYEAITF